MNFLKWDCPTLALTASDLNCPKMSDKILAPVLMSDRSKTGLITGLESMSSDNVLAILLMAD